MTTTQDIVQAKVERIAADAGLTVATDKDFANTGRWHVYNDRLDLIADIHFNFQTEYVCLKAEGLDGLGFVRSGELPMLVDRLTNYLTATA